VKACLFSLLVLSAGVTAGAQTSPVPAKFEVASVKRVKECGGRNYMGPGSISLKGVPLKPVLAEAFGVKADNVQGPSWLAEPTDCFDVDAKLPADGNMGQIPAMLQALLVERFKLATHMEERQSTGYALVVAKGGLKVKEDDPKANFMGDHAGQFAFGFGSHGYFKGIATMAGLANTFSREGYGPVVDETGLTGKYDIDLTWVRDPDHVRPGSDESVTAPPNTDAIAPGVDLFAAVRSLGLQLEKRNVPAAVLVVDHIERSPTEN